MMKLTLSLAAMALAGSMAAQSPQISLAADLGLPIGDFGDFASFIVGPSVGFELPVGDKLGVTAQIGYQFVSLKNDNPFIKSYSMIPVQAGLKYYFTEQQLGFYGCTGRCQVILVHRPSYRLLAEPVIHTSSI